MYAFLDTETTGFARNGIQPRIVSIAWMLADNPTRPRVLKYHVIRPDGFSIPTRAAEIHGISTERATAEGKPLTTVLAEFTYDLLTLNPSAVVAHNASYDMPVISQEYSSLNVANPCTKYETVCTMIQPRSRWPGQSAKLADVYFRIHGRAMDNAHNAMADVWACSQIFFHLQSTI
jgi:DNA polymerase III epsilon subunit-like protein